jgi:TonB family protein
MSALEQKMSLRGEALRVAGLICDYAWSVPKDHYTRSEFSSIVRQQAQKNVPTSTPSPSKPYTEPAKTTVSPSYTNRIIGRITPNIGVQGGPVTVEIRASSDGTIIGRQLIKSSGDTSRDNAVLNGITRTEILPRDTDGRVPNSVVITIGEQLEETSPEAIAKIDQITRR